MGLGCLPTLAVFTAPAPLNHQVPYDLWQQFREYYLILRREFRNFFADIIRNCENLTPEEIQGAKKTHIEHRRDPLRPAKREPVPDNRRRYTADEPDTRNRFAGRHTCRLSAMSSLHLSLARASSGTVTYQF